MKRHLASGIHSKQRPPSGDVLAQRLDTRADVGGHTVSNVRGVLPSDRSTLAGTLAPSSMYAQTCVGCGHAFTNEKAFYSHAPCYNSEPDTRQLHEVIEGGAPKPFLYNQQEDEAEVGRKVEIGESGRGEHTLLEDFEAQLLAAAHGDVAGTQRKVDDPAACATDADAATGPSPPPMRTPDSADEWDHQWETYDAGGRMRYRRVATRKNVNARFPSAASDRPLQATAYSTQGSRQCYGCGKVFWNQKVFWSHSPCFTTRAARIQNRDRDRKLSTAPYSETAAAAKPSIQRSVTPEKHDSGERTMHKASINTSAVSMELNNLEAIINVAPSADVQRLLVSLARTNPEARPIPPIELENLLESGPSMLDLVTRIEKDNAELQKWLKKTQATHRSAVPKASLTQTGSEVRKNRCPGHAM
ncbi:hypothetical protein Slin15195_G103330 [Septoria linicola]|uniref:Uncharacterized protein n=1 Tax=Septoria linicola TaxID=215465 RepID=A0A9Q9ENV8_9PEZI|nr:hypothetical protein Slin14017_G066330 [Septoria linicola]USW57014.1 hypothetical protein Slin15195_G103330 [Septoria linicola]